MYDPLKAQLPTLSVVDAGVYQVQGISLSINVIQAVTVLQRAGFLALVTGGALRDFMLGVHPRDVDLVTDAAPRDMTALFQQTRRSGSRFPVMVVKLGDQFIEIATVRCRDGEMAPKVKGPSRHAAPLLELLDADSTQRDFTLNAMYYDPLLKRLYDPCGGITDTRLRLLRPISTATACIQSNPLTMMRAVRFTRCHSLTMEEKMQAAILANAALLVAATTDRRLVELIKHLGSGHALACMKQLCHLQLHHYLLPGLDALVDTSADGHFLTIALSAFDAQPGLSSYASLFATLLWPAMRQARTRHALVAANSRAAMEPVARAVLTSCGAPLDLERHLGREIIAIWLSQCLLEEVGPASMAEVSSQTSFRAGLNLLMLRCEAGEVPASVAQWWLDAYAARKRARPEPALSSSA